MNEKQRALLGEIAGLLRELAEQPSATAFQIIEERLRGLILELRANDAAAIDCVALETIHWILVKDVGDLLAGDAPSNDTLDVVAGVCAEQYPVMAALARANSGATEPLEVDGAPYMLRPLNIVIEGAKLRVADDPKALALFPLTMSLVMLRDEGVKRVRFDHMDTITREELAWLYNAARTAFRFVKGRIGTYSSVVVSVPGSARKLYARLVFTAGPTIWVRFESTALLPAAETGAGVDGLKAELMAAFGLKGFEEVDTSRWTVRELLELKKAFAKIPEPDRRALVDCLIVRRAKPATLDKDAEREMASYNPVLHCLTLLDSAFAEDRGFVGIGTGICPYSHWTILHEVGHAVDAYYRLEQVPRVDFPAMRHEVARLKQRQAEAKTIMDTADSTDRRVGPAREEYWRLNEQIKRLERELTETEVLAFGKAWTPGQCLLAFRDMVRECGAEPFTPYALRTWPGQPGEFFAEAYTAFLNEPEVLEFAAPDVFRWFADGDHRIGAFPLVPVASPAGGMTDAQFTAVRDLRALLGNLQTTLELVVRGGKSPDTHTVTEMRTMYAVLDKALTVLTADLKGTRGVRIERLVIEHVREALSASVQGPLVSLAGPPGIDVCKAMHQVCATEGATLAELARTAPALPAASLNVPLHVRMRKCTIVGDMVLVDAERESTVTLVGLSRCIVLLRAEGFRQVRLRGTDRLSDQELMWVCNAARKVFLHSGPRFGLAVNVVVSVPQNNWTCRVQFRFERNAAVRIQVRGFEIARNARFADADEAKTRLKADFGLRAVTEADGGRWTLAELVQVWDALAKVPVADRWVLRGCTLVRKGAPKEPASAEERREKDGSGAYWLSSHTLTLLDGAFPDDTQGFVGSGDKLGPHSHWIVLRHVGHAVEQHNVLITFGEPTPSGADREVRILDHRVAEITAILQAGTVPPEQAAGLKTLLLELGERIAAIAPTPGPARRTRGQLLAYRAANRSGSDCLLRFTGLVSQLGVSPITPYAAEKWGIRNSEFFAEAYTLFLNDPDILAWISPALYAWFTAGDYRTWPG